MRRERESFIMGARRRFSAAFKRQVVEELLAGVATAAQLCRRHEVSSGLLRQWQEQYAKGQLADPEGVYQGQEERLRELDPDYA
jgi:transposase-like protein